MKIEQFIANRIAVGSPVGAESAVVWSIFDVCWQIWALGLRAKAESAAFC